MKKLYILLAIISAGTAVNAQQRFAVINNTELGLELLGLNTVRDSYQAYPDAMAPFFFTMDSTDFHGMTTEVFENTLPVASFPINSNNGPTIGNNWYFRPIEFGQDYSMNAYTANLQSTSLNVRQKFHSIKAIVWDYSLNPPGSISYGVGPYDAPGNLTYHLGPNYELSYYELNTGTDKIYVVQLD